MRLAINHDLIDCDGFAGGIELVAFNLYRDDRFPRVSRHAYLMIIIIKLLFHLFPRYHYSHYSIRAAVVKIHLIRNDNLNKYDAVMYR